jgi:hypothetical protein
MGINLVFLLAVMAIFGIIIGIKAILYVIGRRINGE